MLAVRQFLASAGISQMLLLFGGVAQAIDLDHAAGLKALAEVHPADPEQLEFGVLQGNAVARFLQRSNAARKVMGQYGGAQLEYQGEGWLERREEGDRFWLVGAYPVAVDLEKPKPGAATSVEGPLVATFEPGDPVELVDRIKEKLEKANESELRRLPTGQGPLFLWHAAITHANGSPEAGIDLAKALMAEVDGQQIDLMLAGAVNQLSEVLYLEALDDYRESGDLGAFASAVESILTRFEGSSYWESAFELLLANLQNPESPEDLKDHPVAKALIAEKETEGTERLLSGLNRQFWLYEPELLLNQMGNPESPLTAMVVEGRKGLHELLPLLQDRRLTPILDAQAGTSDVLNSHFHNLSNFYGTDREGEAERRFQQLPHPLTVAEVAGRLLDPFLDYRQQQLPPAEKGVVVERMLAGFEGKGTEEVVLEILADPNRELQQSLAMTLTQLPGEKGLPVMLEFIRSSEVDFQMLMIALQWMQRRPQVARQLAEALGGREFDPEAILAQQSAQYRGGSTDYFERQMKLLMSTLDAHREPVDAKAFFKEIARDEDSEPQAYQTKWHRILEEVELEELVAWWKVAVQTTESIEGRIKLLGLATPGYEQPEAHLAFRRAIAGEEEFWAEIDGDERLIPHESFALTIQNLGRWIRWTSQWENNQPFTQESFMGGGRRWADWMLEQLPAQLAGETPEPFIPETLPDATNLVAKAKEQTGEALADFLAGLQPGEAEALQVAVEGDAELRADLSSVLDQIGTILPAAGPEWAETLAPFKNRLLDRSLIEELIEVARTADRTVGLAIVRPILLQPPQLRVFTSQPSQRGMLQLFGEQEGGNWHPTMLMLERSDDGLEEIDESQAEAFFQVLSENAGPDATQTGFLLLRIIPPPSES